LSFYFCLEALNKLGGGFNYKKLADNKLFIIRSKKEMGADLVGFNRRRNFIMWSTSLKWMKSTDPPLWFTMRDSSLAALAHELQHATDYYTCKEKGIEYDSDLSHKNAIKTGNKIRGKLFDLAKSHYTSTGPWTKKDYMRPGEYDKDKDGPLTW
jgi:hypothetical protein